jgi:hypothetical protein
MGPYSSGVLLMLEKLKARGGGAMRYSLVVGMIIVLPLAACVSEAPLEEQPAVQANIDVRSYRLGGIGAFSEVVSIGIKKLALSAPMAPQEMDALMEEAQRIAKENGVKLYREEDLLVTDLFPASLTEGKHVLLIYLDPVKDEYLALKAAKQALVDNGEYEGDKRLEMAREMGRLLSYPEEHIKQMLAR